MLSALPCRAPPPPPLTLLPRFQDAVPINTQLEHLGQKYLGLRPRSSHAQAVFNGMMPEVKGNHPVPISNFMNAQCKSTLPLPPAVSLA